MRARSSWERSYEPRRTRERLSIVLVLVGGLLGGAYVAWHLPFGIGMPVASHTEAGAVARPFSGARPGAAIAPTTIEPVAAPPVQPTAPPAPAATPSADQPAVVTGTDGTGVVLRASPRDSDWTPRGFMDGVHVQVLERLGGDWARVRGPNGQEGWVPARYLAMP